MYVHEGIECGLLLDGELEVELEDKTYHLKPGDSITIRSDIPHRLNNKGKKLAKGVWVNSKPWIFSIKYRFRAGFRGRIGQFECRGEFEKL
jgi:uncharacterized cupin superfamily protein